MELQNVKFKSPFKTLSKINSFIYDLKTVELFIVKLFLQLFLLLIVLIAQFKCIELTTE